MRTINQKRLISNTIMLYLLTFSSYFFGFISLPYQTRVLGPEYYGRVGFALAFMVFFKLFIDFGFLLSATEEVAKHHRDKQKLSEIVTAVNILKCILSFISFIILL